MKKRIFKVAFATVLTLVLVLGLASCGAAKKTLPDAESDSGKIDGTSLEWEYDADSKTLTVDGEGAIPDCSAGEDVWWHAARHNIEKVELSDKITEIGDYAFYYCPELEDIELPEGVTRLGKLSFAFCSSLEGIDIPEAVNSVGEACFEACTSLTGISLTSNVTHIGARAFAYCSALKDVVIMAQIDGFGEKTFVRCTALEKLQFNRDAKDGIENSAADAFEYASLSLEDAKYSAATGEFTVTVEYVYEDGSQASETVSGTYKYGESFSFDSPELDGYMADQVTVSGLTTEDEEITVTYKTIASETEAQETETETEAAPVQPEEEPEGITASTVITIIIFAVVIIAIVVLAIVMMRSDKKPAHTGKGGKDGKSGKNGKKK